MEKGTKYKNGIILGKFLPFTTGHNFLMETGASMCEHLTILVCSIKREPIPGELRFEWVKEVMKHKNITVVHINEELPQYPEEDKKNFWRIWTNVIQKNTPNDLDVIFSSESYGDTLAEKLNIKHVMVDQKREKFQISGTMVRENPLKYWNYITAPAKSYFVKRIVLVGVESTGKSVLCKRLAEKFNTIYVSEYGREFCEQNGGTVNLMDFPELVIMQNKLEEEAAKTANKILFCDTENITTKVFCSLYHPKKCKELDNFFEYHISKSSKKYHKYFLLSESEIDSVQDGTRCFLNRRTEHEDMIIEELKKRNIEFDVVEGGFDERFEFISSEIEKLLNS